MEALSLAAPRKLLSCLKQLFKIYGFYLAYKFFRVWFPRQIRSVKGATVLVTGAAGGLGESICKEFAKRGVKKIVCWDLNREALDRVKQSLLSKFTTLEQVQAQVVNLANHDDIYSAAKSSLENIGGRIDIVVNNAGIVTGQNFLDTPDKQLQLTMGVNAMAPMYTTKAFLPGMLKHSGGPRACLINISSFAGYVGASQMVDYTASKFATRGFTEALSAELKQLGHWDKCRVSCICPSHIRTEMFKGFSLAGTIAMSSQFVAEKVVSAYECDQELVLLPRHLTPCIPLIGLTQALGYFQLPNPQPRTSPLKNFDRTHADEVLKKMET